MALCLTKLNQAPVLVFSTPYKSKAFHKLFPPSRFFLGGGKSASSVVIQSEIQKNPLRKGLQSHDKKNVFSFFWRGFVFPFLRSQTRPPSIVLFLAVVFPSPSSKTLPSPLSPRVWGYNIYIPHPPRNTHPHPHPQSHTKYIQKKLLTI